MEFKKNIYQKVWRKVGGMWRICCNFDPENDFYIGVQYHPEFKSRPDKAHPLFKGLIAAALNGKNNRR